MIKKEYIYTTILILLTIILLPLTFSKYKSTINTEITLNIVKPTYTIVFHSNNGNDTTSTQVFTYGTSQVLNANTFSNSGRGFLHWNTEPDDSGTSYTNSESVLNLSSVNNDIIDLYAQWATGIVELNGTYYDTIHEAVDDVLANNLPHTINLLANLYLDTTDRITIDEHKNIIFNFGNYTITNVNDANIPLIENSGTISISNGNLVTNAAQGAINNSTTGIINITGGTITVNGTKQAIYNGGVLNISGNPTMTSVSSNRATVQNLSTGTLTITGGTISSSRYYGLQNEGTLTIGDKDGTIDKTSPSIQGTYGVYSTTSYTFYDGILKGSNKAYNDRTLITEIEDNSEIVTGSESIGERTYKTAWLSDNLITITFNYHGGTGSETERIMEKNAEIAPLPSTSKTGYIFQGWYTAASGGTKINAGDTMTASITLHAQWKKAVATVNNKYYASLQSALNAAASTPGLTITLLDNTTENVTVSSSTDCILDIQSYTITNKSNSPVITNNGSLKIISGTITSSAGYSAINNNSGAYLEITGGSIIATGTRQAIYNNGGNVVISGTAYLSNQAPERAAVQNLANSTITITGGTIVSQYQQGVKNEGTLTIGEKDGTISTTSPVIQGFTYGVTNTSTLNYYDGIIKGITNEVSGSITEREANTNIVHGTEVIGTDTYKTQILEAIP